MEKQKSMPELRFPEFNDKWKYEPIGNHVDFLSGFPFNGVDISEDSKGLPLLRGVNITEGSIRHSKDIDRYYNGDVEKLQKYILVKGDLVIGMDGSKVGKNSALIDLQNANSLLVQRVARLREKEGSSIRFIYQHINSIRFHKYVDEVKTSSGIPHISASQIKDFKISFPQIKEQEKIASFLNVIDKRLQTLKKKKSLLEQYKKGVMQKIFSQALRFKDDNGKAFPNWKTNTLAEICEIVGGGTPGTNIEEYWNGDIQWFTPTEIKSDYVSKSIRTITELGLKKSSAKLLPAGTILLTTRATIGEAAIANEICSTNQGFQNLIVKEDSNNIFVFNWIKENKYELTKRANGSTFPEISKTEIEKILIPVPCKEEQTKIANFLSAIDEKINNCNTQIEKTENYKRGLLQKMFV